MEANTISVTVTKDITTGKHDSNISIYMSSLRVKFQSLTFMNKKINKSLFSITLRVQ